jgi:hypothetical protein
MQVTGVRRVVMISAAPVGTMRIIKLAWVGPEPTTQAPPSPSSV